MEWLVCSQEATQEGAQAASETYSPQQELTQTDSQRLLILLGTKYRSCLSYLSCSRLMQACWAHRLAQSRTAALATPTVAR